MLKVYATVRKVGWVRRVKIVVSMASQLTTINVNVNHVTMVWIVQHFVQTKATFVSKTNVIVVLTGGEESFVKDGDVQV